MSRRPCIIDFKEAVKGRMSKEDADDLLEDIRRRAKDRVRLNLEPKGRAFNKAVDEILAEEKEKRRLSKLESFQNQQKFDESMGIINRFATEGRKSAGLGLQARMDGVQSNIEGGKRSTGHTTKAMANNLKGDLISQLRQTKLGVKGFSSGDYETDIAREIAQEGSTDNEGAREIAKAIKSVYERGRNMLNSEGARIGTTKEYLGKRMHNVERMVNPTGHAFSNIKLREEYFRNRKNIKLSLREFMREKAYDRWKNFVTPLLDNDVTFEAVKDKDKFLRSFYDATITGVHNKPFVVDEETQKVFRTPGPGNFAARLGKERVIHFKPGGDAELAYMREYGSGSLASTVETTIERMGNDYGILNVLGTNPLGMFFRLQREVLKKYRNESGIDSKIKRARVVLGHILNEYSNPITSLAGKIYRGTQILASIALLPAVTLRSIPDLAIRGSKLNEYGQSYFKSYVDIIRNTLDTANRKNKNLVADMVHAWSHSVLGDIYSRANANDTPFGLLGRFQQLFFKLNFMRGWDNLIRSNNAVSLAKALNGFKDLSFEDLPKSVQINLSNYDIKPGEWDLMRKNSLDPLIVKNVITPDIAKIIPREQIREHLGLERLSTKREIAFRQELNTKWATFFQNEMDDMQIQPSKSTIAFLLGASDPNTAGGITRKMFAMFKYFGVESTRRTLGRMIYGQGAESIYDAVRNGKGSRMALLSFMANTIVLNYIGASAVALSQGKTAPDPTRVRTFEQLLLNSGAFGYYGSLLASDYSRHDFFTSLFGPVAESISNVAKLVSQIKDGDSGKSIKNTVSNLTSRNVGFINLPYIKLPLDYLFLYGWMEHNNPGYLQDQQDKLKRRTGQNFILPPTQFAVGR